MVQNVFVILCHLCLVQTTRCSQGMRERILRSEWAACTKSCDGGQSSNPYWGGQRSEAKVCGILPRTRERKVLQTPKPGCKACEASGNLRTLRQNSSLHFHILLFILTLLFIFFQILFPSLHSFFISCVIILFIHYT